MKAPGVRACSFPAPFGNCQGGVYLAAGGGPLLMIVTLCGPTVFIVPSLIIVMTVFSSVATTLSVPLVASGIPVRTVVPVMAL